MKKFLMLSMAMAFGYVQAALPDGLEDFVFSGRERSYSAQLWPNNPCLDCCEVVENCVTCNHCVCFSRKDVAIPLIVAQQPRAQNSQSNEQSVPVEVKHIPARKSALHRNVPGVMAAQLRVQNTPDYGTTRPPVEDSSDNEELVKLAKRAGIEG